MRFETSVKDIITRTDDVKSFRFSRSRSLDYKPGQFMFVSIRAGQGEMKKHFTISSSPTERDYIEFTKRLTGSEFSNALEGLEVGDWAGIDAPYGDFTFEGEYKKVGILIGGIGITPIRSICRYCTDMQLDADIVVIYSNRTERDIIFRGELERMQEQNKNLRVAFTLTQPASGWTELKGRIDAEMVKAAMPDYVERVFYSSGPPAMVEATVSLVRDLGVPEKQIRKEHFPGY